MLLNGRTRLRHAPEATYQVVAGEAILIHLKTGVYYSLNEVGTAFWKLLDGQRTLSDCAAQLSAEYAAPPELIQTDLVEIADKLVREGLAERVG